MIYTIKPLRYVLVFTAIFMFLSAGFINAEYGIKGGVSYSKTKITGVDVDPFTGSYVKGFQIGLYLDYRMDENLSLQPGVYYVEKGLKQEWVYGDESSIQELETKYLEFPLLLKYDINPGKSFNPYLIAGGYGAVLLKAQVKAAGDPDEDVKDFFKKMDYGLIGGIGVELGLGSMGNVVLEARYNMGLTNAHKILEDEANSDYTVKNRSFSFLVGFRF